MIFISIFLKNIYAYHNFCVSLLNILYFFILKASKVKLLLNSSFIISKKYFLLNNIYLLIQFYLHSIWLNVHIFQKQLLYHHFCGILHIRQRSKWKGRVSSFFQVVSLVQKNKNKSSEKIVLKEIIKKTLVLFFLKIIILLWSFLEQVYLLEFVLAIVSQKIVFKILLWTI